MGKLPVATMTLRQRAALHKMRDGERHSAYDMAASLLTLDALATRGMIEAVGIGHMALPHNAGWRITADGRAALATLDGAAAQPQR